MIIGYLDPWGKGFRTQDGLFKRVWGLGVLGSGFRGFGFRV